MKHSESRSAFEDPAKRTAPTNVSGIISRISIRLCSASLLGCLEEDPLARPPSALAVVAASPGGDPLAAALAAGETPSPEIVAASEDAGTLSVRMAVVSVAAAVLGLIAASFVPAQADIEPLTPFPNLQEILAYKARDIATRLGCTGVPADSAGNFEYDT